MENQWFSSKMIYNLQIVIFHGFSTSILVCPRVGSPLAKLLIQKTDSFFLIRSFNVQSFFRYIIYIYIRVYIYTYICYIHTRCICVCCQLHPTCFGDVPFYPRFVLYNTCFLHHRYNMDNCMTCIFLSRYRYYIYILYI